MSTFDDPIPVVFGELELLLQYEDLASEDDCLMCHSKENLLWYGQAIYDFLCDHCALSTHVYGNCPLELMDLNDELFEQLKRDENARIWYALLAGQEPRYPQPIRELSL